MSQTVVSSKLIPGARFLDKYRVDRLLGEGGMGVVFAATHLELQDRVAIKLLRQEASSNGEIVLRFVREARAAAQLRSENVVRVYDVGRIESGEPYMVMELLEGHDLANGPLGNALPIGEAVDYVIQACDAMIVAHELGMVHRDLKPANLFLTVDRHGVPTVKVLDFGISKLQHQGGVDGALTQDSAVMGSPLYMSPEQVRSAKAVDARADIWSLGTILFELVTGRTPFEGDTLGAVLTAVAVDAPPLMSSLRDDVPPGLDAIVAKCLEKDPAWRYQTAAALQEALLPFGSARSQAKMALRGSVMPPTQLGSGSSVPPATRAAQTNTTWADTDSGATPPVQPAAERTRRGTWALLAALAALLAVGGSAIVWTRAMFAPATVSSTTAAAAEPLPVVSSAPPPTADRARLAPEPQASASTSEESLAPRPSAMPTGPLPRQTARAYRVPPASPTPGGQQRTVPAPTQAQPPTPPNRSSAARGNDRSSPLDIDFK